MTAVLLWKEYRAQRTVWIALACLSVLVLVGPTYYDHRPDQDGTAMLMIGAVLAWTAGMVIGAIQLAEEREDGTLAFLDGLPARRHDLWRGKFLAGLAFVAGQVAVLAAVAAYLHILANDAAGIAWVVSLLVLGGMGYGFGLLLGARSRTTFQAIGWALVYQTLATNMLVLLAALVGGVFGAGEGGFVLVIALVLHALLVPLLWVAAAWEFTKTDRDRGPSPDPESRTPSRGAGLLAELAAVAWLDWRQTRVLWLVLLALALPLGFLVRTDFVVWPVATLAVGLLFGVTLFMDEQTGGTGRIVGEQRLPPGRVWAFKVALRVYRALVVAVVLLLPSFAIETRSEVVRTDSPQPAADRLMRMVGAQQLADFAQPAYWLTIWLVYGFVAGHLCGMLLRKPLVALVASVGVVVLLLAPWLPPLLGGGLTAWQVFGVPFILLVGMRLLMWPWATERLASVRPVLLTVGVLLLTGLWTVGVLAYRIVEVPETDLDIAAFVASIPSPEQNEAGRLIRAAGTQLEQIRRQLDVRKPTPPPDAGGEPGAGGEAAGAGAAPGGAGGLGVDVMETFRSQAEEVLRRGWPRGKPELGGYLDELFALQWADKVAEAARLPTGMLRDPRTLTFFSNLPELDGCRDIPFFLVVRGLQQQAAGDPEAFVERLRESFAVAAALRNKGITIFALVAGRIETESCAALDRWLERLDGRPDLLRPALRLLVDQEQLAIQAAGDRVKAEAVMYLNSVREPESWGRQKPPSLVAFAWRVPYEQARLERLALRIAVADDQTSQRERGMFPPVLANMFRDGFHSKLSYWVARRLAAVRARQIVVALRLYEADTGKTAENLHVLVPKYLPSIPLDPQTGEPFGYWLAGGEVIDVPPQPGTPQLLDPPFLAASVGQGVLTWKDSVLLVPMRPTR